MSTLLFDIGATKTRVAIAGRRTLQRVHTFTTPQRWSTVESVFRREIQMTIGQNTITAAVGGLPGTLDSQRRRLLHATNLPGWSGRLIRPMLAKVFCTKKIRLENDANLAGLGEAVYGAGKKYSIVAYLGIGTGVGGTRIVDQQLDRAVRGFRPGHHIIDASSTVRCACGQYGDLEGLVSGRNLERQLHRPANVLTAVAYRRAARYLGIGVNNITTLWTPDVVVLGGSVMSSLWPYRRFITGALHYRSFPPQVVRGILGDNGGLYGALELARIKKK